jgi:hypothetical protein
MANSQGLKRKTMNTNMNFVNIKQAIRVLQSLIYLPENNKEEYETEILLPEEITGQSVNIWSAPDTPNRKRRKM